MPLYEYQCDACGHRFEMIRKFSDPPLETCPKCGGAGPQAAVVARDSVQGHRLVHHRLREEGQRRGQGRVGASGEGSGDKARQATKARDQGRAKIRQEPNRRPTRADENASDDRRRRRRAPSDVRQRRRQDAASASRTDLVASPARRVAGRATSGRPRTCSARSGRRSAK